MFFGLVFLLFFQLVSDFIETIYAFGLLGTNIPPEIVSVLFFFTPLILLFFRRGLPYRVALALAGLAALAHPLEVMLDPKGKMLASGFGVGCLFVLLPVLLLHRIRAGKESSRDGSLVRVWRWHWLSRSCCARWEPGATCRCSTPG